MSISKLQTSIASNLLRHSPLNAAKINDLTVSNSKRTEDHCCNTANAWRTLSLRTPFCHGRKWENESQSIVGDAEIGLLIVPKLNLWQKLNQTAVNSGKDDLPSSASAANPTTLSMVKYWFPGINCLSMVREWLISLPLYLVWGSVCGWECS